MKFESVNDIFFNIEKYTQLEKELISKENDLLNHINNHFLFSYKVKQHRKEAYAIRNNIIEARAKIKYCYSIFNKYTTFDKETYFDFLVKYLSKVEQEEYCVSEQIEENTFPFLTEELDIKFFNNYYYVITTNDNMSLFKDNKIDDIDDYLSNIKDNKYICLESDDTYSLLNKDQLLLEYERYPYLKDIAFSLIDIKLKNPNITDKERIDMVIDKPHIKKKC